MDAQECEELLNALKQEVQRNHQQNLAEIYDLRDFVVEELAGIRSLVEQMLKRRETRYLPKEPEECSSLTPSPR